MNLVQKVKLSNNIRKAWKRVFASNDPFDDPFQKSVESRLLLYPTEVFYLTDEQYSAFINTLKEMDEDYFYASRIEYGGDFLQEGEHWKCRLPKHDDYLSTEMYLESALFSESGTFGILISHETHAMAGGSVEFIEYFKIHYPKWRREREEFSEDWKKDIADPVLMATA